MLQKGGHQESKELLAACVAGMGGKEAGAP